MSNQPNQPPFTYTMHFTSIDQVNQWAAAMRNHIESYPEPKRTLFLERLAQSITRVKEELLNPTSRTVELTEPGYD